MDAFKQGLLLSIGGIYGNIIRISPPLTLTIEEAERGIEILRIV
jgi:4-aminobutyrate aminotransferase